MADIFIAELPAFKDFPESCRFPSAKLCRISWKASSWWLQTYKSEIPFEQKYLKSSKKFSQIIYTDVIAYVFDNNKLVPAYIGFQKLDDAFFILAQVGYVSPSVYFNVKFVEYEL